MKNVLDKFFYRSKNLDQVSQRIRNISHQIPVGKIFDTINNYSSKSEIRYVGGCIRKLINNEPIDDIDLATNLTPNEVCNALKKKEISYYETGIEHGTITALIEKQNENLTTTYERKLRSNEVIIENLTKTVNELSGVIKELTAKIKTLTPETEKQVGESTDDDSKREEQDTDDQVNKDEEVDEKNENVEETDNSEKPNNEGNDDGNDEENDEENDDGNDQGNDDGNVEEDN